MTMTVINPTEGRSVSFRGLGARFLIGGEQTGERFSLVEHPIAPRVTGPRLSVQPL